MKLTKVTLLATFLLSCNAMVDTIMGLQPTVTAPIIEYAPEGTIVPMLDMHFNCGDCEQNAKIKALVEGAYLDQAELEKAKVDDGQKTIYQVNHFRSRGKARFFVGMLAGADNITGTVSCNGVDKEISDTAIHAINGIEAVARNVGKAAYQAIKHCVLNKGMDDTTKTPATTSNEQETLPVVVN